MRIIAAKLSKIMKLNFQQKLIGSFIIIFAAFTAGIIIFEQQKAKRYKTEALQERLDAYADEISQFVSLNYNDASLDSLLALMPSNLRLTLIDRNGNVIYDNTADDYTAMDNHSDRPEIQNAIKNGHSTFIRTSASVSQPYLYYAKDNGNALIVRVALPYDIRVQSFLKPDNAVLYFIIVLFLSGIVFIYYVSRYFGRSITQLRDFSIALNDSGKMPPQEFPDDEFGQVASRLADDFKRIRDNEMQFAREREKLLLHIQTSAEGVCFFNSDRTVAFYNGLYMQYFNTLTGHAATSGQKILSDAYFRPIVEFLNNPANDNYYETRLVKNDREFLLRLNIFEDESFEIILTDITAQEKTRRLKQEMTGNIAHELRTPVTSIRGFLEILLNNKLDQNKEREYLERAYAQTKTLSALISDMSLLTRIDERHEAFGFTEVNINRLLEKVDSDTSAAQTAKNISFTTSIPEGLTVKGNESLLYSVFRNLTDNVIHHAGENVAINIKATKTQDGNVRFIFSDNGKGIADEQHLGRLFERFYRVNEGRTRESGGSGLGLSIVKNAVRLHGGDISVRNAIPHGLEFIITIPGA